MTKRVLTLGADPEISIQTVDTTGDRMRFPGGLRPVPVCGLFGGDKGAPISQGAIGGWLEDGVMLELNPAPATTALGLSANTVQLLHKAQEYLNGKYPTPKNMKGYSSTYFLKYPGRAYYYQEEDLRKDPRAVVFGCAADYSAYSPGEERGSVMDKAMAQWDNTIRFAGGHVHLGLDPWPEDLPKWIVIRLLDLLVGMPSARRWGEAYSEREPFYGLAGLYRETKYGVEYRTPSNRWLNECSTEAPSYFLTRLQEVGTLLQNYEKNKDALVDAYNSVDWGVFNTLFSNRNYGDISDCLAKAEVVELDRVPWMRVGDSAFCLSNHTSSMVPYESIAKKLVFAQPAQAEPELARIVLEPEHEEIEFLGEDWGEPPPPEQDVEEPPPIRVAAPAGINVGERIPPPPPNSTKDSRPDRYSGMRGTSSYKRRRNQTRPRWPLRPTEWPEYEQRWTNVGQKPKGGNAPVKQRCE